MLSWSKMPFGRLSSDGQFRIVGPVNEPGFKGYKLFWGGEHVGTFHRLMDARTRAETIALEYSR